MKIELPSQASAAAFNLKPPVHVMQTALSSEQSPQLRSSQAEQSKKTSKKLVTKSFPR